MKVGDKCRVVQNLCDALSPVNKGILAKPGEILTVVSVNDKVCWYDLKHNSYQGEVSFYCADNFLQQFPKKDLQIVE